MEYIQHEGAQYTDPAFPLSLHMDQLHKARRSIYTNWHDDIELLYCLEGNGSVLLGSETIPFQQSEVVVIGSNMLHTIYTDSPVCTYQCLIVSPRFLSDHGLDIHAVSLTTILRDERIVGCFEQIVAEYKSPDACFRTAVIASVLSLFVILFRDYVKQAPATRRGLERDYPLPIMQALQYMASHLCEPMSIDAICRHVGMSKYYFCRTFRAYTGMSVIRHINQLRCDYARKLICENGLNVSQAAHRLGIHNLSYFSRLYKEYMGILPSKART